MESNLTFDIKKKVFSAEGEIELEISAIVPLGDMVALFGISGAGKTTLLRMLAGLTNPDEGRITWGKEIWFDSSSRINIPPQRRNIGYMFQDYALFPNMTVKENLRYAQPLRNNAMLEELLHTFGLAELENRKPSKLSGGQRQRVALARAIARRPNLLLLDEPLSALDLELRSSLQEEIRKVHDHYQITTIMVSHDLAEVFRLAKKVLCIDKGRVTRSGSPAELFSNNDISGKVQISGQLVNIEAHSTFYTLTVVTGLNQVIKVVAFENDMVNMKVGDQVMVFTKAFNPMIMRI